MFARTFLLVFSLFPAILVSAQDASSAASTDATDTGDTGDATPAASSSPDTAQAVATSTVLGGAGQGGGEPIACVNCEGTYEALAQCADIGTAETCSPLCGNYTSTVTCVSCLVANGQNYLDQATAQQVIWNLEASCENIGSAIANTVAVDATPTTTGMMTTIGAAITAAATSSSSISTTPHSGLTAYTSVRSLSLPATVSTSLAINPTTSSTGAGARTVSTAGFATFIGLATLAVLLSAPV